jgi:hypothetical protein
MLAVTVFVLTGCAGSTSSTRSATTTSAHAQSSSTGSTPTHPPVTPSGHSLGRVSTPGTPKGEQTVAIAVVATPGAAKRATLALVPVYIDGHGPFPFALDTGASRSLIANALAHRLRLPHRGSAGKLYGIVAGATAENVLIAHWRAGTVALPLEVVAELGQASATAQPSAKPGGLPAGPLGLLGSDVLSRYGKIAIDYDKSLLILDPPVR